MKLHVRHRTHYGYAQAASQSHNHICLQPRDTIRQRCLSSQLQITPEPDIVQYGHDVYGNMTARFSLSQQHEECDIVVASMIDTLDTPPSIPESQTANGNLNAMSKLANDDALLAADCLLPSPYVPVTPVLEKLIDEVPLDGAGVLEYADKLMRHIYNTFEYQSGFSTIVTPLTKIVEERKGVCQDFAHLAIGVLRQLNIPARYVSGYLETLPPPGQEKLQGSDASHAWFAVFDAASGWYDFDPTNNKMPDNQYITTAWGRDYADVAPIKGVVYGGGRHTLTVEVDVTRVTENKLTTLEY